MVRRTPTRLRGTQDRLCNVPAAPVEYNSAWTCLGPIAVKQKEKHLQEKNPEIKRKKYFMSPNKYANKNVTTIQRYNNP